MTKGRKHYHGAECEIIDEIYDFQALMEENQIDTSNKSFTEALTYLRPVIESLNIAGSLDRLRDLMTAPEHETTAEDFDFRKINGETDAIKQLQIVNLLNALRQEPNPEFEDMFNLFMSNNPMFAKIIKHENSKKFLQEFFDRMRKILAKNAIAYDYKEISHGRGILPFCSLFNHSCDPNIGAVQFDNKFAFIAIKPIAKDEQLFMYYT
jgi:hypothetical protein